MQPQMKAQELQKVSQNVDTFSPVANQKVPQSKASQLLATLDDVLPGIAEGATSELGRVIQEDETRQASRALTGMQPTDDATVAGAQAHKNVNTRNAVSSRMRELATEATEFEGSSPDLTVEEREAEWEEHVLQVQSQLVTENSKTPEDIEMIGTLFRDMLPKIADTRYQASQQQDQIAKYRTAVESFENAVDPEQYTEEEMMQNVNQILVGEGDGMGMTTEARRKAFVDSAINSANRNDLTLIDIAKDLGLYTQEAGLVNAERSAEQRMLQDQQAEIALNKSNLISELSASQYMTEEQFYQRAQEQGQWNEAEMRNVWEQDRRGKDLAFERQDLLQRSMDPLKDENAIGVSFFGLSSAQAELLVQDYNEQNSIREAMELEGIEDPQAIWDISQKYTEEKAKWLTSNHLVDPSWEKQFAVLGNSVDASAFESETLPSHIGEIISRMDMLSSSHATLSQHADTKTLGIYENYQKNLSSNGGNEVHAWRDAYTTANTDNIKLRRDETEKLESYVDDAVASLGQDNGWFNDNQDANEGKQRWIRDQVYSRALNLMSEGKIDMNIAVERAKNEMQGTHTLLTDGSYVQGKPDWISAQMKVPEHQMETTIHNYRDALVDSELMVSGVSGSPDTWRLEIGTGGNVIWRDQSGIQVTTRPITLGEVGGTSLSEQYDNLWKERESLHQRRIDSNRRRSYRGQMSPTESAGTGNPFLNKDSVFN